MSLLSDDRLFSAEPTSRALARALYKSICNLPIISPHGHVDPSWFADNQPFRDAVELMIVPDHYVLRMLVSQGHSLDDLGVPRIDGTVKQTDRRKIWRIFAENYYLFRATPSRMWLDQVFQDLFGLTTPLSAKTADHYFDEINRQLQQDNFRPRALFDRFGIEVLATTESPLDNLAHHAAIRKSGWNGNIVTTYRPDAVIDPDHNGFLDNLAAFENITGQSCTTFEGYLEAHRISRHRFKIHGATATDHGHPTASTKWFSPEAVSALYDRVRTGQSTADEAEQFRAHMLTEMAVMSLDDGLVMQLHPGSHRNHAGPVFDLFGRDKGFDIPKSTNYVDALKPLLARVGFEAGFRLILFTLDETTMSRELAPLAGAYPSLLLGPAWWFYDSADGMRRYREMTTETAGFYNTAGFNDDTRALCSIPARHDVARRVDAAFLADCVVQGKMSEADAYETAYDLTYTLPKKAYRL